MKRIIALLLALGLACAPIAIANQDTEVSVGGYTTRTLVNLLYKLQVAVNELNGVNNNNAVLNNWNVTVKELVSDHNSDQVTLATWVLLLREVALDIDDMKVALANWSANMAAGTNSQAWTLKTMPSALSANTTPAAVSTNITAATTVNVSNISLSDSVLGSGTKTDPSISLTI